MHVARVWVVTACTGMVLGLAWFQAGAQTAPTTTRPPAQRKPQPRPVGQPETVDVAAIGVDDGDTITIHGKSGGEEVVRILGIDTPETRHDAHGIPLDQPFGREAEAFARGVFAVATDVKLVRSETLDPYGRTLGYVIVNGKNYSVLVVKARLAEESISFYGDNGLPALAAEVTSAAKTAGPLPFEPPHVFRKRMRALSDWQKAGKHDGTP
jgi:micrococcal nuclease